MGADQQAVNPWIPDSALIIAMITATSYFWALWYELGKCNYFQINPYLISLSSTSILFISPPFIIGVIVLLLVWLIANQIQNFSYKSSVRMFFTIMTILILGLLVLSLLLYLGQGPRTTLIFGVIVVSFIVVIIFLYPLFAQRKIGLTYWDRLINGPYPKVYPLSPALRLSQSKVMIITCIVSVFIIVVGANIIYKAGQIAAQTSEIFNVIKESPQLPVEVVVLRIYGDYLITAPLVRSTEPKQFKKTLYLLKISELSNIPLITEKLGRLDVEP
jgi:hypothetical protein